ncbi:MAG: thiamine pyrophosphate-binding protein, partial [Hyphomicrobiaceae bacterium]|nr:thiamine pyrophosphate-binding protein [Hyphomicrobiaceae bacterium]
LFDIPAPRQKLVHIHADPNELGRVYQPHRAINASPSNLLAMVQDIAAPPSLRWRAWTEAANRDYRAWSDRATEVPGDFNL